MATPEEAFVTTLWDQSEAIADEILHHNPLLKTLDEKGKVRKFTGGYEIRKAVMYNDTAVGGFYQGASPFNLSFVDDATYFAFPICQVYEPVAVTGREKRANQGEERLIDLLEMKKDAAISRLKNTVSTSIRSDGTGSGGIEFSGIKKAVSGTPSTGTYGGIDRATNTWARNYAQTGLTFSATNVQGYITDGLGAVTRGDEYPDLGISGRDVWNFLHNSLTAIQRINAPTKTGKAGFRVLNYDGCDFVFDGGYGSSVLESNVIRLLNTNYWTFDAERETYFKPLAPEMDRPIDQDAYFTIILVEGNLCCSAPALQAYMGT